MNKWLTAASHRMLKQMRDGDDNYAISEGRAVWVDYEKFSPATLYKLLRLCLIRSDSFNKEGGAQIWTLNEDGERIIDDESFEPPIVAVMRKEKMQTPDGVDEIEPTGIYDWCPECGTVHDVGNDCPDNK